MFMRPKAPALLRDSALAPAIPRKELLRLSQLGTAVEVPSGEEIIARASRGRECFIVVDGDFKVEGNGFTGRITDGELAGELALLTGSRRNASVAATKDSVVYALHPQEFATLLSDAPEFRRQVLDTASERLGHRLDAVPAQILPGHERDLVLS